MSIRSTNVYEEQSLGIFEAPVHEDDEPEGLEKLPSESERVGRYVGWHLRRQLSIGQYNVIERYVVKPAYSIHFSTLSRYLVACLGRISSCDY